MTSQSPSLDAALSAADTQFDASLERLFALLRIPSISTDPAYDADVKKTAAHVHGDLESLGFKVTTHSTPGHPMIVAKWDDAASDGPRALFYGHYDVQPVDPLELWDRDPFDPIVETRADGSKKIVARGAADDKGQIMTFIEACRACIQATGKLPIPITIILEGEEESGSPSLPGFLDAHTEDLRADVALVCDTNMWDAQTPAITTRLRGLFGTEVVIKAADKDLHSGLFGGPARNPAHVLASIIADLHDENGRITLPGFYDGIAEVPDDVMASWNALGFSADDFLGAVGLSVPAGEKDRTALEQMWSRPTLEVNGMTSGYTGQGFKTVLPAQASAKISCRLVKGQDPEKIRQSFEAFVSERLPADCSAEFHPHGMGPGIELDVTGPAFQAAKRALTDEWPNPAAFTGIGGSIPIVGQFQERLGLDSVLVGFGLSNDQIHSPNEKYELESYRKGIRSWVRILHALADA
jgi:acetylornithine deacetylase/succinyl-diaminopimelate desuccinylase-like protein